MGFGINLRPNIYTGLLLFLYLVPMGSFAQKNAIGLSAGYSYFQNNTWNKLEDTYHAVFDTVQHKHPYLHHLPGIGLVYERRLAEYLYVQPFAQYQRATTVSTNNSIALKLKVQFLSAGANINWYPFKMALGQKKSVFNPFYFRLALGASYLLNTITLDGKVAYDDSTQNSRASNLAIFAEAGLGYDLHFGRLVVQPFLGFRAYPGMYMQSMTYFIDATRRYDQEDTGFGWAASAKVSLLYLF
jgi:hypothetical protein